jgi:hypothetical protein
MENKQGTVRSKWHRPDYFPLLQTYSLRGCSPAVPRYASVYKRQSYALCLETPNNKIIFSLQNDPLKHSTFFQPAK